MQRLSRFFNGRCENADVGSEFLIQIRLQSFENRIQKMKRHSQQYAAGVIQYSLHRVKREM